MAFPIHPELAFFIKLWIQVWVSRTSARTEFYVASFRWQQAHLEHSRPSLSFDMFGIFPYRNLKRLHKSRSIFTWESFPRTPQFRAGRGRERKKLFPWPVMLSTGWKTREMGTKSENTSATHTVVMQSFFLSSRRLAHGESCKYQRSFSPTKVHNESRSTLLALE